MAFEVAGQFPGRRAGVTRTVLRAEDGSLYCDCPSWRFQTRPPRERECKHTRAVLDGYTTIRGPW